MCISVYVLQGGVEGGLVRSEIFEIYLEEINVCLLNSSQTKNIPLSFFLFLILLNGDRE